MCCAVLCLPFHHIHLLAYVVTFFVSFILAVYLKQFQIQSSLGCKGTAHFFLLQVQPNSSQLISWVWWTSELLLLVYMVANLHWKYRKRTSVSFNFVFCSCLLFHSPVPRKCPLLIIHYWIIIQNDWVEVVCSTVLLVLQLCVHLCQSCTPTLSLHIT